MNEALKELTVTARGARRPTSLLPSLRTVLVGAINLDDTKATGTKFDSSLELDFKSGI